MDSPASASPTSIERPRAVARINTYPTSLSNEKDLESFYESPRARIRAYRRSSTLSSISCTIHESGVFSPREDTPVSLEAAESPSQLERATTGLPEDDALPGYPKLASHLGGREGFSIYKRFASLNTRNLLYWQAKLIHLEYELDQLERQHAHHTDLHHKVQHLFAAKPGTPGDILRQKYEEISLTLDKYNQLLLDQKKLHDLPSPDDSFVESIYNFITSPKTPNPDWLQHPENTIYAVWDHNRKPLQKDLVTLNPEFRSHDPFTKFFTGPLLNWWHSSIWSRFREPDDDLDGYVYREATMSRYMRAVVMIVAAGLPTCSIIALYFIEVAVWRLIFVVVFSGVFAAVLVVFTDARSLDIFSASVALAAVQVVFIGTAFGNGNHGTNA